MAPFGAAICFPHQFAAGKHQAFTACLGLNVNDTLSVRGDCDAVRFSALCEALDAYNSGNPARQTMGEICYTRCLRQKWQSRLQE